MPRTMDLHVAARYHARTTAIQVVDHAIDRPLIAGDHTRRNHYQIIFGGAQKGMLAHADAREGRHRLALATGTHHQALAGPQLRKILAIDHRASWHPEKALFLSNLEVPH